MLWFSENATKAAEPPDWSIALSEEIWFEHACRVAFFSQIIERDSKAGRILMVKVHCKDQRSFEASQSGRDTPFIFSECKPREQNAC